MALYVISTRRVRARPYTEVYWHLLEYPNDGSTLTRQAQMIRSDRGPGFDNYVSSVIDAFIYQSHLYMRRDGRGTLANELRFYRARSLAPATFGVRDASRDITLPSGWYSKTPTTFETGADGSHLWGVVPISQASPQRYGLQLLQLPLTTLTPAVTTHDVIPSSTSLVGLSCEGVTADTEDDGYIWIIVNGLLEGSVRQLRAYHKSGLTAFEEDTTKRTDLTASAYNRLRVLGSELIVNVGGTLTTLDKP